MNITKSHLCGCLAFLFASVPLVEGRVGIDGLVEYVEETMFLLEPSSYAIVVSKGTDVVFEAYRKGSFDGLPEVPVDRDSMFFLASCTKSFSSGVLMRLVEQGVVDLSEPVSRYLEDFSDHGGGSFSMGDVTILHLASHTSGLEYHDGASAGSFSDLRVTTKPGETFQYSLVGITVLQRVLEKAAGRSFVELMQDEIIDPLGLDKTGYVFAFDSELPLVPSRAQEALGHDEHFFFSSESYLLGSGLYSTARDVNSYSQFWIQNSQSPGEPFLSSESVAKVSAKHAVSEANDAEYGILWWVFPDKGAIVMSGATHSVSAIIPESGVVVTVLRNYFGQIPQGFVFHEDKIALVNFAIQIGEN